MKILLSISFVLFLTKNTSAQIPFFERFDSIGVTLTPTDTVVLYKKCITAKKDTLRFFKDREEKGLIKIICALYNPSRSPVSDRYGWAYYFIRSELVRAASYRNTDKRRAYGSVEYLFRNRKLTDRSPVSRNMTSTSVILREADELLKLSAGEKCAH